MKYQATKQKTKFNEEKVLDYAGVSDEMLAFWEEHNIFQSSIDEKEGNETFTFYEGPPSANGTPGIHHVMARTVKDVVCRYKTMKGFQVRRKGGWDTHGLPVELQVEKELGITKEDIGSKISVEAYNQHCREAVMKYKGQWDDLTRKMGYWVDLDDPYITFENNYIETLWHLLKRLHQKDFLYKGYTIQPFSPAAGTGLSSHELNQPGCYKMVKDTSVVAQFKLENTENVYFLAWTTTPWTLPSNAALAVGENITYVKVDTYNAYTHQRQQVMLAKDLLEKYFNPKAADLSLEDYEPGAKLIPWKVTEEMKGKDLIGTTYEQLMPYVTPEKPAFRVIKGDFITTEDGTGIVHIAPTFGADDARAAQQSDIPPITVKDENGEEIPLVDRQGRFIDAVTDFAGEYVKEDYLTEVPEGYKNVDIQIAIKLKEENKAFKVEKYEHSYPHCWRTDKPVLYYPLESWFIRTTAVKDKLVALNKTINWKPASTGQGRFGNWLENLVDWNLSRSRYWGTPLPIWRTEDGKEEKCIGSIKELEAEMAKANEQLGENNPETLKDLHRPYVDDIILVSDSGQPMKREADLIDVWFDSGAMPYAQWHYPFENEDVWEKNFPADFIAEGVDQTRGWFFTLHAIATMLFDDVAYKNVIANGLVLDKNGNKMSKRIGNVIDPFETISNYGPDATRWYMISNAPPWDNLKFNLEGIKEVQRRFFATFHNTYNFFALYANLDGFAYKEASLPLEKRTESDCWIISRLHTLIRQCNECLDDYDLTRSARMIQDFVVDELSNWYVRLNRKRFWKGVYNEDKLAAYQTLYECLEAVAKLSAPVAPFYFDKVYQKLNAVTGRDLAASIHLCDYPQAEAQYIDEALETRMSLAQRISSLTHSLRRAESIKVRQPLSKIMIPVKDEAMERHIAEVEELIKTEVNVKEIEYISNQSTDVLVRKVKPVFSKLGKVFGPKMKQVAAAVNQMSQEQIAGAERDGEVQLSIGDETITLGIDDLDISFQDIPGWLVATERGVTVALDVVIDDELRKEGVARDLVNRIQNIRKDKGYDVQDKINVAINSNDDIIKDAVEGYGEYIKAETQALSLVMDEQAAGEEITIDDLTLTIKLEVVS